MEEYLTKKVITSDLEETIETYKIFGWEVSDKSILGYKTMVVFNRDTDMPHYQEIVALEKKWNKETDFPAWPTYLFIILALLTITVYLIVSVLTGFTDKLLYFLSIMLPGLVFFMLGAGYFYLRTHKIQKIIETYYEKRREYRLEIERIKGDHK